MSKERAGRRARGELAKAQIHVSLEARTIRELQALACFWGVEGRLGAVIDEIVRRSPCPACDGAGSHKEGCPVGEAVKLGKGGEG